MLGGLSLPSALAFYASLLLYLCFGLVRPGSFCTLLAQWCGLNSGAGGHVDVCAIVCVSSENCTASTILLLLLSLPAPPLSPQVTSNYALLASVDTALFGEGVPYTQSRWVRGTCTCSS